MDPVKSTNSPAVVQSENHAPQVLHAPALTPAESSAPSTPTVLGRGSSNTQVKSHKSSFTWLWRFLRQLEKFEILIIFLTFLLSYVFTSSGDQKNQNDIKKNLEAIESAQTQVGQLKDELGSLRADIERKRIDRAKIAISRAEHYLVHNEFELATYESQIASENSNDPLMQSYASAVNARFANSEQKRSDALIFYALAIKSLQGTPLPSSVTSTAHMADLPLKLLIEDNVPELSPLNSARLSCLAAEFSFLKVKKTPILERQHDGEAIDDLKLSISMLSKALLKNSSSKSIRGILYSKLAYAKWNLGQLVQEELFVDLLDSAIEDYQRSLNELDDENASQANLDEDFLSAFAGSISKQNCMLNSGRIRLTQIQRCSELKKPLTALLKYAQSGRVYLENALLHSTLSAEATENSSAKAHTALAQMHFLVGKEFADHGDSVLARANFERSITQFQRADTVWKNISAYRASKSIVERSAAIIGVIEVRLHFAKLLKELKLLDEFHRQIESAKQKIKDLESMEQLFAVVNQSVALQKQIEELLK